MEEEPTEEVIEEMPTEETPSEEISTEKSIELSILRNTDYLVWELQHFHGVPKVSFGELECKVIHKTD